MELGLASESLRLRLNRPSPPPRLSPPVSERPVAVVFARAPPPAGTPAPLLLVCRVTGFYPRPVRVAWLQDGEEVAPSGRLSSSGILPNADLTYQLRSSLAVEPGDGHSYACRVEHSSLGGQSLLIPWGAGVRSWSLGAFPARSEWDRGGSRQRDWGAAKQREWVGAVEMDQREPDGGAEIKHLRG
ncbi:antigen-presenting glycoprotein CD1d-like [Chelonia mydas]|uniref:antigen-presenting glycoprotein CD1d-like n=1 Tax=Chelonia mydas TaxID=8469 RepID=UPI0018A229A1|nr:antigen-presenting glycoprotein CD1d-like [Chelonia mydas]